MLSDTDPVIAREGWVADLLWQRAAAAAAAGGGGAAAAGGGGAGAAGDL
jgi:hypothetical protein